MLKRPATPNLNLAMLSRSPLQVSYSSRGRPTYRIEVAHAGLKKHRVIKGDDDDVVRRKADLQVEQWEEQWTKKATAAAAIRRREKSKSEAARLSREADEELRRVQELLQHTLGVDDTVDWSDLKDKSPFPKAKPSPPATAAAPPEPRETDAKYAPQLSLLDKLLSSRRGRKLLEVQRRFEADRAAWERACADHEAVVAEANRRYEDVARQWETEESEFLRSRDEANKAIDDERDRYLASEPDAIRDYCDLVLARSEYPESFPKEWELEYVPETRILLVDYSLPAPEQLPTLTEVKYIQNRNEMQEKHLPAAQLNKLYDDVVYQITLRTLHELFEADAVGALDAIVFNGWVRSIDKGTGREATSCILSVQATKPQFVELNLSQVEPKACFKALKGVGSSKLHSITPVAPLLRLNRDDKRFVNAYAVASELDESSNLAAMSWEDFEHLIRELFEKEFAQGGGEVKVTQASRDGGVDAIAFDPDPIRGGKIVIQAKRYTNTVGVAAVRDLYGTVVNEGATKGILVTTSDYGPDAYEFAKGKPLTLLNGGNLLHLLQRHGHSARIDLQEARRIAAERR